MSTDDTDVRLIRERPNPCDTPRLQPKQFGRLKHDRWTGFQLEPPVQVISRHSPNTTLFCGVLFFANANTSDLPALCDIHWYITKRSLSTPAVSDSSTPRMVQIPMLIFAVYRREGFVRHANLRNQVWSRVLNIDIWTDSPANSSLRGIGWQTLIREGFSSTASSVLLEV